MLRTLLLGLAVGFGVTLLANLATTIYLHRALSHRALTLHPAVVQVFRFIIWITTGIRPRQWVAVHRKHHAFTDVDGDPHSPVLHGWIKVQMMNVAMYRREARNPETLSKYARDLPQTWADRWFYDHALLGLAIGVAHARRHVRVADRTARRVRPRQPVPRRIGGGERDRPPLRSQALRQHGGQPAVAGLPHRRRGTAQQPPRPADVGQAGSPLVRDRPGLVRDQGADLGATGQGRGRVGVASIARPKPRQRAA